MSKYTDVIDIVNGNNRFVAKLVHIETTTTRLFPTMEDAIRYAKEWGIRTTNAFDKSASKTQEKLRNKV